jgi:hypothetical protein
MAHETLINPSLRLKYQITEENASYDISNDLDEETTQDVFERVVNQVRRRDRISGTAGFKT